MRAEKDYSLRRAKCAKDRGDSSHRTNHLSQHRITVRLSDSDLRISHAAAAAHNTNAANLARKLIQALGRL